MANARRTNLNVGFEALTALIIKIPVFWDIMPLSPAKVNQRFGGIFDQHFQGFKVSKGKKPASKTGSLVCNPEDGDDVFLRDVVNLTDCTSLCHRR